MALSLFSFGQSLEDDPQMILAENLFNNQDYGAALENYKNLEGRIFNAPYLKYKLGLCYYHSPNQKEQAIEYLQYALKYRNEKVPPEVYYYLGRLYHYTYKFEAAIDMFESYKKDERNFNLVFIDTERLIEMCYNGIEILKMDEKEVEVEIASPPTNTSFNDYAPLVRPNGQLLMFSSDRPTETVDLVINPKNIFIPKELQSGHEDVFMAYPRGISWDFPYPQGLKGKKVIPLSFRSNGSELLLFIGSDLNNGDLYISKYRGSRWTPPKKLSSTINSRYDERGACFAENGKAIYFASNRPNGYGGFDLYVSLQDGKDWGTPINLGPTINTKYDEDNPFMLPGEKYFYFSSDGHNSMGGLDIFQSKRIKNYTQWNKPVNLGYPINSTFDDDYFVQRTDGKYSFLSSNRNEIQSIGSTDIISIFKPEKSNPMVMVKGKLTIEKDNKLVEARLKVYDKHTHEEQSYVYNPDLETGEYFMILAPRKTYEVHILTGDDYDHTIDITLPEEAYSYELNKHIVIESFNLFGQKIGEKPNVKSSDYSLKRIDEAPEGRSSRYDALDIIIARIIDAQDVQKKTTPLNQLDDTTPFPSKTGPDPYYTPIVERINDIINNGTLQDLRQLERPVLRKDIVFAGSIKNNRKLVLSHSVLFNADEALINEETQQELNKLGELLKTDNELRLELSYPSNGGELANERVNAILDFFSVRSVMNHQLKKRKDMGEALNTITIYLYEESQL